MQPIILAAGKGTRMRSALPKTLFKIEGKPMLDHILETVASVPELAQPIIVVGHGSEDIKAHLGGSFTFAHQAELNGTGGAVKVTLPHLPKKGYVFILYGDQPFMRPDTLEAMVKLCSEKQPTLVQSTVFLPDFKDWRVVFNAYGRIIRGRNGTIEKIVEYKSASEEERAVTEVNPGIVAIDAAWLHEAIHRITANPVTGEYYLTEILAIAKAEGKTVETLSFSASEALGINSPEDAEFALAVVAEESVS